MTSTYRRFPMLKNIRTLIAFYSLIGWRQLLLIFFGGLLVHSEVFGGFFVPLLVRRILDALTEKGGLDLTAIYLLGGLYGGVLVFSYLGERLYLRSKYNAVTELRNKIFSSSFFFPWRKLKERGSAYYTALINQQLNDAFVVLDYAYIRNLIVIARMFAILGVIWTWSPTFFGLFLMNMVVVAIYSHVIDRATHPHYAQMYELVRRITAYITETFENLHEILAGEAIRKRCERYTVMVKEVLKKALRTEWIKVNLDKLMVDLPGYVSRLALLGYGGFLVARGQMTVGTLWALWVYFSYITEPLYVFRELARIAVQTSANIESILDYFADMERYRSAMRRTSIRPKDNAPVYVLRDVTFGFEPGKPVLKQVTFAVDPGEIVAIVGLSGEGKSTLLNILLGLEQEYDGVVELLGNDLRGVFPGAVFEHVGYYSQAVGIFNDTLENNIVMGRPLERNRLEKIIEEVGLEHLRGRLLGEGGSFISGGEKQKLQLARLLYADKEVNIIDEPFVNLDLVNEQVLLSKLKEFLSGRSGIIISHKPHIIKLAQRIVVLKEGRVVAVGPLKELLASNEVCREIIRSYLRGAREVEKEIQSPNSEAGG